MTIHQFYVWILTLSSLTSFVLIGRLWYIISNSETSKSIIDRNNPKDYGLLFLAFALLIWGIKGCLNQFYPNITEPLNSILSSINSLFFLLTTVYLKSRPKWINPWAIRIFIVITVFVIIITILSYLKSYLPYQIQLPDFILSIFTVIVFSYCLFVTFKKRGLFLLSLFSTIILFLILIGQPAINFFGLIHDENWRHLIELYTRLSLILIIYVLAFSWVQNNYHIAAKEIDSMTEQIQSLMKEIRTRNERKLKDEIESIWKNVAMKAAHKIGNPVDAIETFNGLMTEKLLSFEITPDGHDINNKTYNEILEIIPMMSKTIDEAKNVLSEFKYFYGRNSINLQKCDLIEIINSSIQQVTDITISLNVFNKKLRLISSRTNENGVTELNITNDELIELQLDGEQIKSCFDELISNSKGHFDVRKKENKIDITVEFVQRDLPRSLNRGIEYVRIIYTDNGTGVDPSIKKKIFTPFFSTSQNGSGFGLSIVQKTIEMHNGLIFENGLKDQGVRFEIYLPTKINSK